MDNINSLTIEQDKNNDIRNYKKFYVRYNNLNIYFYVVIVEDRSECK